MEETVMQGDWMIVEKVLPKALPGIITQYKGEWEVVSIQGRQGWFQETSGTGSGERWCYDIIFTKMQQKEDIRIEQIPTLASELLPRIREVFDSFRKIGQEEDSWETATDQRDEDEHYLTTTGKPACNDPNVKTNMSVSLDVVTCVPCLQALAKQWEPGRDECDKAHAELKNGSVFFYVSDKQACSIHYTVIETDGDAFIRPSKAGEI